MTNEGERDLNEGAWKFWCCAPVIGIAALSLLGGLLGAIRGGSEDEPAEPSAVLAELACKDLVREQLKDPDSADFSNETTTGYGTYKVTGTVRGENSFGGTAVHEFECTVTWNESDDSYDVKMKAF